jgi:hypothetical protein
VPTQVQIGSVTTYENVRLIDCIVDEAEQGFYLNAALLCDQVLRDARIYSTLMTRVGGLLGKPKDFEGAKDTKKATLDAEEFERLFDCMFEHAALVELLGWGLMLNAGVAQIVEDADPWKLDVWHPWALTFDEIERQYFISTREESRLYILPDGKGGYSDKNGTRWVLFTPFGFGNTRRGYLRCLHRLGNERQWSHRDRARFSEIFGQPIRLGIAPAGASKEEKAEYKRKLGLQGAEAVVVAEQGVEGKKWGLELIQANAAAAEVFFNGTLSQLDKEIATLFLGQSQTTDGQAGLGANEMAGEPVRLDMMSADNQALGGALREQFIKPYWGFAYGNPEAAPWVAWRVEPPEDGAKKSLQFKQLMDGFVSAMKAGAPIDMRATMEDYGYPMLSEAEQKKLEDEKKKAAQEAAASQPKDDKLPT